MIKPLIIGHRGAAAEAPENTLASVKKAFEIGVDFVEIDVRLSRDGIPFLFHDLTTCRTAIHAKKHNLSDLDAAFIQTLDAGEWFGVAFVGNPVPTLDELLALDRGKSGLMIEIKEEMVEPRAIAKAVFDSIQRHPKSTKEGPLIIGSFSPTILEEIQRFKLAIPLIGLIEFPKEMKRFLRLGIHHMGINEQNVTKEVMEEFKDNNMSTWVFTVDDPARAVELYKMGVEGIITNDPRKISHQFTHK